MRVIFCLPGRSFSNNFLVSWSNLIRYCMMSGIDYVISSQYSMNIYMCRNICIGANVAAGKDQKPFQGEVEYDYIMWIDSDQVFAPEQFQALLNKMHRDDRHIVSGIYQIIGRYEEQRYACYHMVDDDYFLEHKTFNPIKKAELDMLHGEDPEQRGPYAEHLTEDGLIEVSHNGMGWMMVKKGVFESMQYPWFKTRIMDVGDTSDMIMEDHEFCLTAKENCFPTYIDPSIIVGHEKSIVI